MPYYRALVEYDGTAYCGFQRQREQPTIQGVLEQTLNGLTGQPTTVIGSGRTDSGVHACGQVIGFRFDWQHGAATLQRALNANLPADIVILQLDAASSTFHPRFDARRRIYEYRIYNAAVRSPLRRRSAWYVKQVLEMAKMNSAARELVGVHDFATFGQAPQGDNTIREVFTAEWRREDEQLVFHIAATAFLYRMVRSIVGSLKLVGEGQWTVADFVAAMAARERAFCGMVAPAHGLYLVSVLYN